MRLALLLLLATTTASAQETGTIAGRVLEANGDVALIGATVRVGGTALGAQTNIDGEYEITDVPVGTYSITAIFTGFEPQTQSVILVGVGGTRQIRFRLSPSAATTDCETCGETGSWFSLITADPFASRVLFAADIERMPVRR